MTLLLHVAVMSMVRDFESEGEKKSVGLYYYKQGQGEYKRRKTIIDAAGILQSVN